MKSILLITITLMSLGAVAQFRPIDVYLKRAKSSFRINMSPIHFDEEMTNKEENKTAPVNSSDFDLFELTVFPVPANDILTINSNESGHVELIDMLGNLMFSEEVTFKHSFYVSDLPNGVYFIRFLRSTGDLVTRKIVIRH